MLPQDLRDVFFSDHATMLIVQYEQPGASETTMKAIDEVRKLCNQNCFLAGFSVFIKDTKDLITKEMPLYVLMAVILSAIAMCVMMDSWLLPVALLLSIGLAVIYNFGTNIFLGQISFITQAVAAVLQLGVTMDYSIFLFDRYMEELPHYEDKRDAMASAVVAAFKSVSGSSLTTVAGFLALCFMRLTLGRDIGIVMAKGVVLGVATVILVLPSILLQMDKGIQKFHHKCLKPDMAGVNAFIVRHRKGFVILFVLLFVPAVYANNHTQVYYKLDESLPQDMPSIVSNNKLKNDFNMASTYFIVMEDGLGHGEMAEMEEAIESIPGITSVAAYDKFLPAGIPDFFIPDAIKDICKKDGYQMLMVNSGYVTASDEVALQLEQLNALVKSYDPGAYITGEPAMTADLITTAGADRVLTMDLHASQIQGFFDIPVDNLPGNTIFAHHFHDRFAGQEDNTVVVSPDVGSVARARAFAQKLGMPLAIVDKRRQKANSSEVMNIIGDVQGKQVILLDDMVDTAGSLCHAAQALVDIGGATDVYACASHGVLSGPAYDRIEASPIKELVLLDTIPAGPNSSSKIKYLSVADMFAEAIERIYQEVSVSKLFN